MNSKKWLTLGGLTCLFVMILLLASQGISNAQYGTVRIVRIWWGLGAPSETVVIEPGTTRISQGAVVAWWNKGREEAKIKFTQGKECETATAGPTGFMLEAKDCYVASYIPSGGIASLKFDDVGTYEFEISIKDKGTAKGTVVVTAEDK